MNKNPKKLKLSRDTLRSLSAPALGEVAGGAAGTYQSCSCYLTCWASCRGTCGSFCTVCCP